MKKVFVIMAAIVIAGMPFSGNAQDEKKEIKEEAVEKKEKTEKKEKIEKKETEEIVIRNKGDKALNLKVEINGDNITVNGQPLAEYKNDQVSINKRKMIVRDGSKTMTFNYSPDVMAFNEDFMKQWEFDKEINRTFLGVTTEKATTGAKITDVVKESAAEKAGLKKDDIITKIDDKVIKDGENLSEVVAAKKPKDIVKVSYLRNGKPASVKVTLGERKIKSPMALTYASPRRKVRAYPMPDINSNQNLDLVYEDRFHDMELFAPGTGINMSPYSYARQKRLGLKIQDTEEGGNVKIIDVEEESAAEKAGLKKDDIITKIDGVNIENTDDARKQLSTAEGKSAYTIMVKRGGADMSFEVKFPKKLKTVNL